MNKRQAKPAASRLPNHYDAIVYDAETAAKPDWIWLPNAIIDGAARETAPVELARQTQTAATLRLLIDLYYGHNLSSDGGINWRSIRQSFIRRRVGQQGPFVVHGFEPGTTEVFPNSHFVRPYTTGEFETAADSGRRPDRGWPSFWNSWNQLVSLGLVEFVRHLVEADNDTADIIHPYAVGNGEAPERQVAEAAHAAGEAMVTERQRAWAEAHGLHLAPVRAHITEVQMVGIARLRYRPRTSATAAWFARMGEWNELAARYYEAADAARGKAVLANMQHQGWSR